MSSVSLGSCIRGFHEYQAIWKPINGEELYCCRENGNTSDPYTISVMKGREVVGHVPRKISRMCAVFLRNRETIKCTISGSRRYSRDLPHGYGNPLYSRIFWRSEITEKISKLIKELRFDNRSEGREDKSSESTDASDIAEYEPVKNRLRWTVTLLY